MAYVLLKILLLIFTDNENSCVDFGSGSLRASQPKKNLGQKGVANEKKCRGQGTEQVVEGRS